MRNGALCLVFSLIAALPLAGGEEPADERTSLIIVVGAGGEHEYDETFLRWAENWAKAGETAGARITSIGFNNEKEGAVQQIQSALQREPVSGRAPLWLVLIGHGSADGAQAKFNLRGDDLLASELAAWLKAIVRPVVMVNTFSSSGAFVRPLSAPERIIIAATKGGGENNFSRLGRYLSETIADSSADLDHDGQTSLLEAWLRAAKNVSDFYESEGRLATEHSLLDDNGDGLGTPADWFRGLHVVRISKEHAPPDGLRAHQIHLLSSASDRELRSELLVARDSIERELGEWRRRKPTTPPIEYEGKLEEILVRLARLYSGKSYEQP